jgi:hypothetical protein
MSIGIGRRQRPARILCSRATSTRTCCCAPACRTPTSQTWSATPTTGHFASHLRSERLGEFTAGTELHRSDSLAIVQLLVLSHLVTVRAKVAPAGAHVSART